VIESDKKWNRSAEKMVGTAKHRGGNTEFRLKSFIRIRLRGNIGVRGGNFRGIF